MAAGDAKVTELSTGITSDIILSDEDKKKLEETRLSKENTVRDKKLTGLISGANNNLETNYTQIKAKKDALIFDFNSLHNEITGELHPNYTRALQNRAKKGWAKLGYKDIFTHSTMTLNSAQTALQTGDYSHLNFLPTGMDESQTKRYVYNQSLIFGKQNRIDSENYQQAQTEFTDANNATYQAVAIVTNAIDKERTMVANMRLLDEQLRLNIIAQNSLDTLT